MTYWGIFIPIKNSSIFRKKSPFESISEKKTPPLSLLKKNPLPAYLINIAKGKTGPRVLTQISIKQIQNFDKALTSKYQPNIINISNINTSTNFALASLSPMVASIKFTKCYGVSESVSNKHSQWSDLGPIKKNFQNVSPRATPTGEESSNFLGTPR